MLRRHPASQYTDDMKMNRRSLPILGVVPLISALAGVLGLVRDALRDWTQKRSLRQQGIDELRQVWTQALKDNTSGVSAEDVLDRLERKYKALAKAAASAR